MPGFPLAAVSSDVGGLATYHRAGEVSCAGSGLPWRHGGPTVSPVSALWRCSSGLLLRAISLHSTQTSTSRV